MPGISFRTSNLAVRFCARLQHILGNHDERVVWTVEQVNHVWTQNT